MLGQIRREGPQQELIDAVIDLSLEYGVISPYTSYLVLEPGAGPEMPISQADSMQMAAPREAAALAGGASMSNVAAAPASGENAVADSEARASLETAKTVTEQNQVRFVGGKTFVQRGWVEGADGAAIELWVDTAYEADSEPEIVAFGSEDYFNLAADDTVAQWLSVSPELILVLEDGSAVRIRTAVE